jgi:hypothetical protein
MWLNFGPRHFGPRQPASGQLDPAVATVSRAVSRARSPLHVCFLLDLWDLMSAEPSGDDVVVGEEPEYEEKLDEAPKSILMGMMRQLKVGMDLSRITLPAFILEPRPAPDMRSRTATVQG